MGNFSKEILNGRYEIQQQLGKKAGRQTLLARDLETRELVVVKLLSFSSDFEWDNLKLFEREAETLKTLSHPAIPRYLDYIEVELVNGKGFALVQTYIEAKSLEEHLKAGRTFSNFGSVQTLTAKEGDITVVGTYGYMPPEQFGGRAVPASDLYSLGVTLINLVTGTHPAELPQTEGRIQFEQAANLSPAFVSWLRWITEPILERRLASASEALQALERQYITEGTGLVVRQPVGSRVLLKKDLNFLEILLPPPGLNLKVVGSIIVVLSWCLIVSCITRALLSGSNPIWVLTLLPGLGMSMNSVRKILFALFGRVRLRLDRQQFVLAYELLGFKYSPTPVLSQNIHKLVYSKRSFIRASKGNPMELPPILTLWAGVKKYEIGVYSLYGIQHWEIQKYSSISEPELDWIAQELSARLGLPIIRE